MAGYSRGKHLTSEEVIRALRDSLDATKASDLPFDLADDLSLPID